MKKVAIFASGSGTNAQNLAEYFKGHPQVRIDLMISDRKDAFVFQRMAKVGIPSLYLTREQFSDGTLLKILKEHAIDFIILAGFLKLVPQEVVQAYEGKIVNIHPALLPKHGGKGMYGMRVHQAVADAGDEKTGITIHFVNDRFDEGEVIAQYETPVKPGESPEQIAAKIHELEMKWFPVVVESLLLAK